MSVNESNKGVIVLTVVEISIFSEFKEGEYKAGIVCAIDAVVGIQDELVELIQLL
jgi:hypothetical protein